MARITNELAHWLTCDEAKLRMQEVEARRNEGREWVTVLTWLRRNLSGERAEAISHQVALRGRARRKFLRAGQMLFTRRSLEQATSEPIGRYKSGRFDETPIVDLCCGIGGDLIGLSRNRRCLGVDLDLDLTCFARHNADVYGRVNASTITLDARSMDLTNWAAIHIDPDRRAQGKRTIALKDYRPNEIELQRITQSAESCAIKLAPATDVPRDWKIAAERQWLGHDRECKQQIAWFGKSARYPSKRVATIVDCNDHVEEIIESTNTSPVEVSSALGKFLIEPHSAIRASKLESDFALRFGLFKVENLERFFFSNQLVRSSLCRCWTIIEIIPARGKVIRSVLASLNSARPELKPHGCPPASFISWHHPFL